MKVPVNEIFSSVQGEGLFVGQKHLFLRLGGCPLDCVWCDTPASKKDEASEMQEMSVGEVLLQVRSLKEHCQMLSLTGGEPLLHVDFIQSLLSQEEIKDMPVLLETNGIMTEALTEIIEQIDVVSMDFKLPSSAQCGSFWEEHAAFLRVACKKDVYVKIVVTKVTSQEDLAKAAEIIQGIDAEVPLFIQPNSIETDSSLIQKCIYWQEEASRSLKDVRVLPQLHKILKVR